MKSGFSKAAAEHSNVASSKSQAGDAAPVAAQALASAFRMEVVLIPESAFVLGSVRLHRARVIEDVVAVERNQAAAALRPERGDDAAGAATPVVAGQHGARNGQGVHQRQEVRA